MAAAHLVAMKQHSVAIIGAGVAGLTAARQLAATQRITLFDKSRGPGGRLANRRRAGYIFDFGAQFFTARDPRFVAEVASLRAAGVVEPWRCRFAEIEDGEVVARRMWGDEHAHFVALERMSALAAHWAEGLDIRYSTLITSLRQDSTCWLLESEEGEIFGPFDFVILALPAAQAAALLPDASPLWARASTAAMLGCYALMLGLNAPIDLSFDAALVRCGVLSWLSVSQSRPGHQGLPSLVALSSNVWAENHMEDPSDQVIQAMREELERFVNQPLQAVHVDLHRWRYANCPASQDITPALDASLRLAICGDWLHHGRVEAAYLTGYDIAFEVMAVFGAG
ncbi:hypothetical protein SAMN02746095_03334 [Acidocella aminolytica 101 = DSM 11237]|jgi:predicted NAD/FAD-dependent oxidoreductase|nr:putative NAD/FAD-dependent oxidoreductase [Acidocella aminolytica 101 = DSM 11237]SHF45750.1 hypothetical protein SAMN02746095_03334 [Acidocella aminolytica 101 = DSM 11237]